MELERPHAETSGELRLKGSSHITSPASVQGGSMATGYQKLGLVMDATELGDLDLHYLMES